MSPREVPDSTTVPSGRGSGGAHCLPSVTQDTVPPVPRSLAPVPSPRTCTCQPPTHPNRFLKAPWSHHRWVGSPEAPALRLQEQEESCSPAGSTQSTDPEGSDRLGSDMGTEGKEGSLDRGKQSLRRGKRMTIMNHEIGPGCLGDLPQGGCRSPDLRKYRCYFQLGWAPGHG